MSNKQMVAYAELFEAGGVMNPPNGWRPRWKKEFHDIVAAVFRAGQANWPQRVKKPKARLSEAQRDRIDQLCAERDRVAAALDIESSLLGSRGTLESLVITGEDGLLMDWQKQQFGAALAAPEAPAPQQELI
jgi:ribonuclease D